jgi:hypothetical protein
MRRAFLLPLAFLLGAAACGGGDKFPSICENQVPAPLACQTACDPKPGAMKTCANGYYCSPDGKCDAQCTLTGGQCGMGNSCTLDGHCTSGNQCVGLQCNITNCASMSKPSTTITGTVFAPNGTMPLYGVNVYVSNSPPGPFLSGSHCSTCADDLPADVITSTLTDQAGKFSLPDIPDGDNIPVVFSIGKWRRVIKLAHVNACTSTAIAAADSTLPKSHDDMTANTVSVDMPQIAISTGNADSLECLVRRLGIADKEITSDKGTGRIHLFSDKGAGTGTGGGQGTDSFDAGFGGGTGTFSDSQTLWGSSTNQGKLASYDIVILSCEGAQHVETKSQEAMNNLKAYADTGGRVFLSHWHNIWIEGSTTGMNANNTKPAVWPNLAMWSNNTNNSNQTGDTIDEIHNPKGMAFATWMLNVGGSPAGMRDAVPLQTNTGRDTCRSVDNTNVEQWVYWQKDANTQITQNFQFTTPAEKPLENRCGKVVFSDMHVSGGPQKDGNGNVLPYPTSCGAQAGLSPQEKALAFMFFDIASCVGTLF